ncbi:MAG TPA: DUF6159 family protein [Solirubrobacterales bacterium]
MEAQQPAERADGKTRVGRGWQMTRVAWRLTWRDRTVLLLAVLGVVFGLLGAIAIFFAVAGHAPLLHRSSRTQLAPLVLVAAYPMVFLGVFFHVAIAAAAGARLEGRPMRLRDVVGRTLQQGDHVALWSILAMIVGLAFRSLGASTPGAASLLIWIIELGWVLMTIFVIPLLAMEDIGPLSAVNRSGSLLSKAWGEGLTGLVGIGLWQFALSVPALFLVVAGLGAAIVGAGGVVLPVVAAGVLALLAVAALATAMRQVFAVELYRYAAGDAA